MGEEGGNAGESCSHRRVWSRRYNCYVILSHIGVVVLARPFVGLRRLVVTIATFLSLHYSYSSQMLGIAYRSSQGLLGSRHVSFSAHPPIRLISHASPPPLPPPCRAYSRCTIHIQTRPNECAPLRAARTLRTNTSNC